MKGNPRSLIAIAAVAIILAWLTFSFYPKWKFERTEATLSWDVSGYYFYLPAIFIYKDLKKQSFKQDIFDKYKPAGSMYQSFEHPSGNLVMKYSAGQAVMLSPFFFLGHIAAKISGADADGFSRPYQFFIALGSLFIAILGLIMLRLILLRFFSDTVAALSILAISLATNYLDYASINGAMTHNYLFTVYCAAILLTMRYYKNPSLGKAIGIGVIVGIAALTRPTEIIIVLIPILWGVKDFSSLRLRITDFIKGDKRKHFISAFLAMAAIGSIQPIYWKYVTGEWLVYSYEGQGFSWLKPHILNCTIGYEVGWITYSPIVILALVGFFFLWRKYRDIFLAVFAVCLLAMYISFAWDEWKYGGSLGMRAMVQYYPLLAFPMAAFIEAIWKKKISKLVFITVLAICIYLMGWWVYRAHRGTFFAAGEITKNYYWHILGKWDIDRDAIRLLGKNDYYGGKIENPKQLLFNDFETADSAPCITNGIDSERAICLNAEQQSSEKFIVESSIPCGNWVRVQADVRLQSKEWDQWKMTQWHLNFMNGEEVIENYYMRIQRVMNDGETRRVFFDARVPKKSFDRITVHFWNAESQKDVTIDNLELICWE